MFNISWSGKYLHRDEEVGRVVKLVKLCPRLPVHIYGHNSTGKTSVIRSFLQANGSLIRYALVNCIETGYSLTLLFEEILSQLLSDVDDLPRCDNFGQFLNCLNDHLQKDEEKRIVIVFDHAERLRDLPLTTFVAFFRLPELARFRCCVITVSCLSWNKFQISPTGLPQAIPIFFPSYTKDQLLEILSSDPNPQFSPELYKGYCQLLVTIFFTVCRDLRELKYIAAQNFETYVKPIKSGEVAEHESRKLWKHVEPHLKECLQGVNLRESQLTVDTNQKVLPATKKREVVELPYYSKYLLISAFLASNNRSVLDRRLYIKSHGKVKRHKERSNANSRKQIQRQLKGPKVFPLDRLMAIFYAIIDEPDICPTADLLTQVSSLVSLGFLSNSGNADRLDQPKYKCCATLDFVLLIAKNVAFDLKHYLLDLDYEVFV